METKHTPDSHPLTRRELSQFVAAFCVIYTIWAFSAIAAILWWTR